MKYLLTLAFCLSFAYSQIIVNGVNISDSTEVGYLFISQVSALKKGSYLYIDYGQDIAMKSQDDRLLQKLNPNDSGKFERFQSLSQIFNFMYKNGWEFVQQIEETQPDMVESGLLNFGGTQTNAIRYMFKRKQ